MKKVWKFPLQITDEQRIAMPRGAQLLTVQVQGQQPCLWAVVDVDAPSEDRLIIIHGTGHTISGAADRYIGTFQISYPAEITSKGVNPPSTLVFHVFAGIDIEKESH